MNKIFVKTQNVKNFIGLVENLINKPKNIANMGLVYGEPGLGKSQTALWLACKYDGIYLRATNLMTGRWLLEELVKELNQIPRYLTSDNFNLVVKKLKQNPQVIFIDEIDYLMNNYKTIETLRDIHDETFNVQIGVIMTKMKYYKQAETMYIEGNIPINVISQNLNISRRTLFYWKKKYEWDKKCYEKKHNQEILNQELLEFTEKFLKKLSKDIDNHIPSSKAEVYSFLNILKNLP